MFPIFFAFSRYARGVSSACKDTEFRALFGLVAATLLTGMTFYHIVEGWGWFDSLYFSVTTLTTVGYGDFSPHTTLGKMFTMVFVFVGIGVLLALINLVAQHTVQKGKEPVAYPWQKKKS